MLKKIVMWVLNPRWVVNTDEGDLGLRVWGVNFWYYKWPEPMLSSVGWRYAEKREFGECVRSINFGVTE